MGRRSRRSFLEVAAGSFAVMSAACSPARAAPPKSAAQEPKGKGGQVPRRALGKTGATVAILGVGGSHLGGMKDEKEATRVVHEALDAGLDFFDNAWEYHDGESERRLGKALEGKRNKAFVMTKVCTHGRDAKIAMQQLEESLNRLKTDHLDLWQVHECVYESDPELHYQAGGVLEALAQAKKQGKVRFVGFTGHKHPSIHLEMLQRGFAFDTVQMPLNAFDASYRSFQKQVVPAAQQRGMGVIGMKSLGGHGKAIQQGVITAAEALRYALSLPLSTLVSGIDSLEILHQNLAVARGFAPMKQEEMDALVARLAPEAADGRHELYKSTMHFDGKIGREQHQMPSHEEVPY